MYVCIMCVCMYGQRLWLMQQLKKFKKKSEFIQVKGRWKCRGRQKNKSIEVIKMKMSIKEVMECMTSDGIEWRKRQRGWT